MNLPKTYALQLPAGMQTRFARLALVKYTGIHDQAIREFSYNPATGWARYSVA